MPLTGTIAPTDFGWYRFLSRQRVWEEVNFWTPSTHFAFRAQELSPFLFKLKAPHNAICGFGYFAQYAPLPEWLAWEYFKEGNGCATLADMRGKIDTIRQRMRFAGDHTLRQIGCIVLVGVTFFDEDSWISQPSNWPPRNLRPMRYDLDTGEGGRVWAECLQRSVASERIDTPLVLEEGGARYGSPTLVRPRLGQGAFRLAVTEAYGRACAATGEHSLPALEAAHIRPFSQDGPHLVSNGVLLRADLHRLFEQGYLTVTPKFELLVSDRLRSDYSNGRTYYPLHRQQLSLPMPDGNRPQPEFLQWHNDTVFLR